MSKKNWVFFVSATTLNVAILKMFQIKLSLEKTLIINTFLFVLFLLTEALQNKFSKKALFFSLSVNFLRIFFCGLFLFFQFFQKDSSDLVYIYNFFSIYFIYLFYYSTLKNYYKTKV